VCQHCGARQPQYNSCRNRHCPQCQALAQFRWLEARKQRILPVHHFHVVFTVPAELRPLFLRNRRRLFALLFESASQALLQLGGDPRRLGAQLGVTAVLHTWTRDLCFHPHLHCVVTGGGLALDGERWVKTRRGYLFPVRILGKLFRGKFLHKLRELYRCGRLQLEGTGRSDPQSFQGLLDKLYGKRWNVYSKPPFGSVENVMAYLGRYTHRVAISNARLVDVGPDHVRFQTRHGRQTSLPPTEFLRRFLLHVLPKGFVRIRHFGLHAPGNVNTKLATAWSLLGAKPPDTAPFSGTSDPGAGADPDIPAYVAAYQRLTGIDLRCCPSCGHAALQRHPLSLGPRGPP
jgi:hypothetical protein